MDMYGPDDKSISAGLEILGLRIINELTETVQTIKATPDVASSSEQAWAITGAVTYASRLLLVLGLDEHAARVQEAFVSATR